MTRLFGPEDPSVVKIDEQIAHLSKIGISSTTRSAQRLSREQLSMFIEAAFWASVRQNEGRATRVAIALATSQSDSGAVAFSSVVQYDETQIVKLAPAVPRGGCLQVSAASGELRIKGVSRISPATWPDMFWLEIVEPGIVLANIGPFEPYAVLDGRSNSIVTSTRFNLPHHLQKVLGKVLSSDDILETQAVWAECVALGELARAVLARGQGGTILIVPDDSEGWVKFLNPFPYRLALPDTTIRDVIRRVYEQAQPSGQGADPMSAMPSAQWGDIRPATFAVASLAEVDGAIVISRDLRVIGFGAKIAVEHGDDPATYIVRPESRDKDVAPSPLEDLGGTRHQSAARFVASNPHSLAIVVSKDRRLTVVRWDEPAKAVVAMVNADRW